MSHARLHFEGRVRLTHRLDIPPLQNVANFALAALSSG